MALALTGAATLKPEVGLAQALHDYESVLTDQEKIQLYAQGVPTANDALALTNALDEKRKDRRLHCMEPRLITFLESVQQFSNVVETFVSSNPRIAALVWGGVKLALLTANNISSYFDKLSTLFMDLGRACPRFREFQVLYPSSRGLQKALCDYYAGVVRLCHHSTQLYRTSIYKWLPRAVWSPFESEFGHFKADLKRLFDEVQAEISLAAAKSQNQEHLLQQKERRAADWGRGMLKDISHSVQDLIQAAENRALELHRRKMEKLRRTVLDTLSVHNHMRTYKQLRKQCVPGTSTWLCDTPEFQEWLKGPGKTLWCTGNIGSGKSIISACVTAYISSNASREDNIGFFFCRYDDQASLKARTIIGSIARQLVANLPATAFNEGSFSETDVHAVIEFLGSVLSTDRRYFLILDGLDECEESQIRQAAQALQSLVAMPGLQVKIYLSSRPYVAKWLPVELQPEHRISLQTSDNQQKLAADIDTLIETTLAQQLDGESPELQLGDPTLILTIRETLRKQAQGMFLWVRLHLSDLCDQKSDAEILAALNNLPADLPQTFDRILRKRMKSHDIDLGSRIFRWTAVAKRPLALAELREAIAVEPFQEDWRGECMINDMKKAMACCGNLIFVDEEDDTVHFTHSSVKQYLSSETFDDSLRSYYIDLEKSDTEAGVTCVTYLNFSVFEQQVAPRAAIKTDITSIPSKILSKALPNRLALRLLKRYNTRNTSSVLLDKPLVDPTTSYHQMSLFDRFPFQQYAKQYWLFHTRCLDETPRKLMRMSCKLIEEANWRDTLSGTPWTIEDWNKKALKVLDWVAEENHLTLVSLILDSWGSGYCNQLLKACVRTGRDKLVETILSSGAPDPTTDILQQALEKAAGDGHLAMAKLILDYTGVSGTTTIQLGSTLYFAAQGGHSAMVDLLLAANLSGADHEAYKDAFTVAALFGNLAIVERLEQETIIDQGTLCNGLVKAASRGHVSLVRNVLKYLDYVSPRASRLALVGAAEGGHESVVEVLLQRLYPRTTEASLETSFLETSLRAAIEKARMNGHTAVARRLEEKIRQF